MLPFSEANALLTLPLELLAFINYIHQYRHLSHLNWHLNGIDQFLNGIYHCLIDHCFCAAPKSWSKLEVCIPELFFRDETGGHFPNWRYYFLVPWLEKIRENSRRGGTTLFLALGTAIKIFPWTFLVLFCRTIFSTQQENSQAVLNFGNFWNWSTKFQIQKFPIHFWDWDGTGSGQSWMGRTELGPGRGCSRMLGKGNFPDFPGKKLVPKKRDWEHRPLVKIHNTSHSTLIWASALR